MKGEPIKTPLDVAEMLTRHVGYTLADLGFSFVRRPFRDAATRYPGARAVLPVHANNAAMRAVEGRQGKWAILA